MSGNRKLLVGLVVVAVLAAGGGVGYAQFGNGGSGKKKPLIVLADVQRRTLQDTVTLSGTLARQERRKVTAIAPGRVSAVYGADGRTAHAGQRLFALDGRDAIAENGSIRFFRPLTLGDRGDDVLQLERILAAAGDNPGRIDTLFTAQTQFALAQWQAQHHYPGATPVTPQTVDVSLAQGAGYTLGARTSAGLVIGPTATAAAVSGGVHRGVLTALRTSTATTGGHLTPFVDPALTIQSSNAVVSEGTPATFVITAPSAVAADLDIGISTGGTATSADIVTPPPVVTMLAGTRSVTVTVPTRLDNVVKPKKTITVSIVAGSGYTVGIPASAQTILTNANVPTLRIGGGGTLRAGDRATFVVTADQAPIHDTQVTLTFAGDAVPGTDYTTVDPVLLLRAGHTSASVSVTSRASTVIQPDHHLVVSIAPSPTQYAVGSPAVAVVTILGASGPAALPLVTLSSATSHLAKGQPFPVTISLSEGLSQPLTIALAYGGTARLGTDFTLPGGNVVVPAGQTTVQVMVPTVQDKVVESDRVLLVELAGSSAYRIGSPSSASVTIQSQVLPELTITSSASSIGAGGAATFTITADQAPVKDTSVNYQVIGTAQPGKDFEPLVGTAVLAAGHRSVTVTLRSIKTDVVFQPTDMIVAHWPVRVGQVFVKEGDAVVPGAPVISLTDPNFTVTLQASASDRTKLKLGQHCTVELVGGVDEVPGTISELDDNLTTLAASSPGAAQQSVYEGKIQVGDLGAADGAAVTIKVIDQQATDVITVPVAAVKQNGAGQDVVSVIDLAHKGRVTEVPVQTGLTEGSYVEISKGLKGDETVVVQVDQQQ